MATILTLLVLAFLIGSVPFAVVVSRIMGLDDPRNYGSGNPGATNVLRTGNKLAALLTLLGDAAKGGLVVWATVKFAPALQLTGRDLALIALAVFLGHVFSVFLGFKGGKGVATAAGVLFGIHPLVGAATLIVWIATAFASRYSSLGAVVAAVAAPIITWLITSDINWMLCAAAMAVILVWRHAENIKRLLNGTEGKIGKKSKAS